MKHIIKFSIAYFIFVTAMIVPCPHDLTSIVTITTEDQLKELLKNSQGPCAISFHMDKCGYCTKMQPIFKNAANNNQFNHITFYSVNGPIVQAPIHMNDILHENISGYPSIFFLNQGQVVTKQVGGADQNVIIQKLNQLSDKPGTQKNRKKVVAFAVKKRQTKQ